MLSKQYVKSRDAMKVTFTVDFASDADLVEVAGDFNEWSPQPLKKLKSGAYKTALDLEPGQAYQFRYRIDGVWENDWAADDYVANGLGEDNSVVMC
jgi:1,4-alpha-glucan branching enzyme